MECMTALVIVAKAFTCLHQHLHLVIDSCSVARGGRGAGQGCRAGVCGGRGVWGQGCWAGVCGCRDARQGCMGAGVLGWDVWVQSRE